MVRPTPRSWYLALGGLYLVLAWASSAAVTAYQRFGYSFGEPVNYGRLAGDMMSLDAASVVRTYFTQADYRFVNMGMLATVVIMIGLAASSVRYRDKALLLVAALTAPVGLIGLLVSVQSLGRHDGEWLAEGWPMLEVTFVWSVAVVVFAVASARWMVDPR